MRFPCRKRGEGEVPISIRSQILTHFVRGILRFVRIPSTGDEAAAAALS
jgi:hypothetical protein